MALLQKIKNIHLILPRFDSSKAVLCVLKQWSSTVSQSPDNQVGLTEVETPGTPRSWRHDCPLMPEIEFQLFNSFRERGVITPGSQSACLPPQ